GHDDRADTHGDEHDGQDVPAAGAQHGGHYAARHPEQGDENRGDAQAAQLLIVLIDALGVLDIDGERQLTHAHDPSGRRRPPGGADPGGGRSPSGPRVPAYAVPSCGSSSPVPPPPPVYPAWSPVRPAWSSTAPPTSGIAGPSSSSASTIR